MADIANVGFKVDTGALVKAERALEAMGRTGTRAGTAITQRMRALTRSVFSLQGAIGGLGIGLLANSFLSAARETETLRVRLRALTGSAENAAMAFEQMQKFASSVPFTFQEIQQSGALLLTTVGNVSELGKMMEITGDIAAASGLSFQETAMQIQRSFSAGINSADLFRERGVRAMLGFEDGVEISAEETRRHILSMWDDGVENRLKGGANDLAQTWDGVMSMIMDRWFLFRQSVMESGLFQWLKAALTLLQQTVDENFGNMKQAGTEAAAGIQTAFESLLLTSAAIIDTVRPITDAVVRGAQRIMDVFNGLPAWVQNVGLFGAIMLGPKFSLAMAGAMGAADAMARKSAEIMERLGIEKGGTIWNIFAGAPSDPSDKTVLAITTEQAGRAETAVAAVIAKLREMQNNLKGDDLGGFDDIGNNVGTGGSGVISRPGGGGSSKAGKSEQAVLDLQRRMEALRGETEALLQGRAAWEAYQEVQKDERAAEREAKRLETAGVETETVRKLIEQYRLLNEERRSAELVEGVKDVLKKNAELEAETEALLSGRKAWEEYKKARRIQQETDQLKEDLRVLGATEEQLERLSQQRREILEKQEEATKEMERQEEWMKAIESSGKMAFDRIGSAITEAFVKGEQSAVNWGGVVKGILSEVLQTMARMALTDIFASSKMSGGGGGGGIWGTLIKGAIGAFAGGGGGGMSFGNMFNDTFGITNAGYGGVTDSAWLGMGFADGGSHRGGLRMVGEEGPELEVTGPSRIMSNKDLMAAIGGGGDKGHVVNIFNYGDDEVRAEKNENGETDIMIIKRTVAEDINSGGPIYKSMRTRFKMNNATVGRG